MKEESGKQPGLAPSCQGGQPSEGGRTLEAGVRGPRPAPSLTGAVSVTLLLPPGGASMPSLFPLPPSPCFEIWIQGRKYILFSLMYANLVTETCLFSLIYANHFNYTCRMMRKNFLSFNRPILVPTCFVSSNTYFLFNSYNCFAEH